MVFRDDLAAAHARIAALELENQALRDEVARLTGRARLDAPLPVVRPIGAKQQWVSGRVFGWTPGCLAYVGGIDDDSTLRVIDLATGEATDRALIRGGQTTAARIGHEIIVQLPNGELLALRWPQATARSLHLPDRLRAPPAIVDIDQIACVTVDGILRRISLSAWAITATEPWRAADVVLGRDSPDQCEVELGVNGRMLGYGTQLATNEGWNIKGALRAGDERAYLALERRIGGRSDMAIALAEVPRADDAALVPVWLTRAGDGEPFYFYALDGLVVLRNLGIGAVELTFAVDRATGAQVFRIEDAFSDARYIGADDLVSQL